MFDLLYGYSSYSDPMPGWAVFVSFLALVALLIIYAMLFFKVWEMTDVVKKLFEHVEQINNRQIEAEKKDKPEEPQKWIPSWVQKKKDEETPGHIVAAWWFGIAIVALIVASLAAILGL